MAAPTPQTETLPKSTDATEDQMDMAATLPQHSDNIGTKIEDEAGTGEIDSSGG
jgi:hypothetical protein